jgi:hypothetical protein
LFLFLRWQVSCPEQLELEHQLDQITAQLRRQHFVQSMLLINTLSKQQLAQGLLSVYPYMPDSYTCKLHGVSSSLLAVITLLRWT